MAFELSFTPLITHAQNTPTTEVERTSKTNDSTEGTPQSILISGAVVGNDNLVLAGINVICKGNITGTVTDTDGNFTIRIDNPKTSETLLFSFIGLLTRDISINTTLPEQTLDTVCYATGYRPAKGDFVVAGLVTCIKEEPHPEKRDHWENSKHRGDLPQTFKALFRKKAINNPNNTALFNRASHGYEQLLKPYLFVSAYGREIITINFEAHFGYSRSLVHRLRASTIFWFIPLPRCSGTTYMKPRYAYCL